MELSPEIRQKIEEKKGELVKKAQNLLKKEKHPVWEVDDKKFGDRQLKNLLDVANSSPCIEVVENFIKYQIGRDEKKDGWAYGGFGSGLIKEINSLQTTSQDILGSDQMSNQILLDEVKIRLARLFIGYLTRYFKFKRWLKKNPENGEVHVDASQEEKSS